MVTSDSDAERQELNRRRRELDERLQAARPDERDAILEEVREIVRQLQELSLDERIRNSMEGGSEG